jgi:hypothetical protein
MTLYLISYDLNKPEKDYPKLISYIESLSGHRVLFSEWFVRGNYTRDALYAGLKQHVDANDGLLVCAVSDAVGSNLKYDLTRV